MNLHIDSHGKITFDKYCFRASIGKNGVGEKKSEGDHVTPIGRYPLRRVLYRADRVPQPKTRLPTQIINPNDGWCNDPKDPFYNQLIQLPFTKSHEVLWRKDCLYDCIVTIGYNDNPVIPWLGSAIFMHIAKPSFKATEGCIGVEMKTMIKILELCREEEFISISCVQP